MTSTTTRADLRAYVPGVVMPWQGRPDEPRHRRVDGSLAFVDISGFTRLTERLARHGHVGSEETSDLLDLTFDALLGDVRSVGADLVKWAGDAVLLLFEGPGHERRAAATCVDLRETLRRLGPLRSSAGSVRLRMSVGAHSGPVDLFLVGDQTRHRELIVAGPTVSRVLELQSVATAGEILLSPQTALPLPRRLVRPGPATDVVVLRGRPDPGPAPAPARRSGDPSDFLPRSVLEHVTAEGDEAEHRSVCVAFVRFAGTDGLIRDAGPTVAAAAVDACVRVVQQEADAHGVTFLESDMDRDAFRVMLVAGAPRSAGRDEERMLRCLRAVVDADLPLAVSAGISRGHVFTGGLGPAFRRTYSVKGDAVNLAARLTARAGVGEVIVTPEVLERSETEYVDDPMPPFEVKGKKEPVRASRLGAVRGRRATGSAVGRFVGRESESRTLLDVAHRAAHGAGGVVEVVGEPGIGKSRLVDEVLTRTGLPVLRAVCEEYEESTPYFPLRGLLRRALALPPDAGADATLTALAEAVSDRAPHLTPWIPLLALPLDLTVPGTAESADLDEKFRRERLERSVIELLEALLPEPTALVVDDAHFMDSASVDLLDRLANQVRGTSWILVVTRRDLPSGFAPRPGDHVVSVRLTALGEEARRELARSGSRQVAPAVLDALVERCGGNPLFLEALLEAAARDRSGSALTLPESVESLVTLQVDRLDPLDRTVLRYAAVLGHTVDGEVLEGLLAEQLAGVRLAERLPRLEGLLEADGDGRYRFRHALVRDVAYAGLPFRRRRPLHAHVAAALESSAGSSPPVELLSLHWFAAGRVQPAWRYSVLAGRRASAKYAHADAADFYERAVLAARSGAEVAAPDLSRAYEDLGDARLLLGSVPEAEQAFERARRLVHTDRLASASLVVKLARVDQRQRRFDRSLRRIARATAALAADGSSAARAIRAHLADRAAVSLLSQGKVDRALARGAIAAREAEDASDRAALAEAYAVQHGILVATGRTEEIPYGRLALQAYAELGDLAGQGHCLNNLAVAAIAEGRWDEALTDFRKAADIFERLGDTSAAANATFNQADVLVRQGRTFEAAPLLAQARVVAAGVADDELVALAAREAGRVAAREGRIAEAIASLDEAAAIFERLGEAEEHLEVDVVRVEVDLLAGDPGRALERIATLQGGTNEVAQRPDLLRLAAAAHHGAGRPGEALRQAREGLESLDGPGDDYERGLLLIALERAGGDGGDGRALLRTLGVVATPFGPLDAAEVRGS